MLEQQLSDLESAALARIQAARSPQDLEAVRVEVLGRKGALTQVSKDVGKLLNAARQKLESADESRRRQFDAKALQAVRADTSQLLQPAACPSSCAGPLQRQAVRLRAACR